VKLFFYGNTLFYNPYADMCLDLTEGKEDYGATVNLYKCNILNGHQQWEIPNKGDRPLPTVVQIFYTKDNWCLDAGSRATSGSGTPVTIWPCDMNVQAQKWTMQFYGTYDKQGAELYFLLWILLPNSHSPTKKPKYACKSKGQRDLKRKDFPCCQYVSFNFCLNREREFSSSGNKNDSTHRSFLIVVIAFCQI
jgi:hypothetical protein